MSWFTDWASAPGDDDFYQYIPGYSADGWSRPSDLDPTALGGYRGTTPGQTFGREFWRGLDAAAADAGDAARAGAPWVLIAAAVAALVLLSK